MKSLAVQLTQGANVANFKGAFFPCSLLPPVDTTPPPPPPFSATVSIFTLYTSSIFSRISLQL